MMSIRVCPRLEVKTGFGSDPFFFPYAPLVAFDALHCRTFRESRLIACARNALI